GLGNLTSLKQLTLSNFNAVEAFQEGLGNLTSLETLHLSGFNGVEAFPEGLGNLTSLKQLTLSNFNGVEAFPERLGNLTSLQLLHVSYCRNLKHLFPLQAPKSLSVLVMGPFCSELEEFPGLDCIHHLHASLKYLELTGWEKVKFLPDQLQHFTALESLILEEFNGVEVLPNWLGNLTSLRHLRIRNCRNLTSMPSLEAMQRLSDLQSLFISECPKLKERCARDRGAEWSKISHIPQIGIDGRFEVWKSRYV
ncbi:hypothetical protein SLA2020_244330, partial [Shorea laevis]